MPRVLMLLLTLTSTAGAVEPAPVPFETDDQGAIIVPAWIDGRGPYRFLLDTGSTLSAVSHRVADQLVLRPVALTALTTSGGTAMRLVVQLGTVTVGGAVRNELLASLASERDLSILGARVDGVLGQDFLATFNFSVDYRRRTVAWEADEPAGAQRLPLVPRDGRFVIQLPRGLHDAPLEMVPDSGASTFVLFAGGREAPRPDRWTGGEVTISGLTGSQRARYAQLRELRVGALTLRNIPVVVVLRKDGEHEGADGLLPLHLFSRVTFRVSDGYLAVER
jgi:predicted aspartyl protease